MVAAQVVAGAETLIEPITTSRWTQQDKPTPPRLACIKGMHAIMMATGRSYVDKKRS